MTVQNQIEPAESAQASTVQSAQLVLFGDVVRKAKSNRGRPSGSTVKWVAGETPPAFPDKPIEVTIEGDTLIAWRKQILKGMIAAMGDERTTDNHFIDCLDWLLDDSNSGCSFIACALSASDDQWGDITDPEQLRENILFSVRHRVRDIKQKWKSGSLKVQFDLL